jgi:hypothetical protein
MTNDNKIKRAGEILSVFFDERLMKKAQGYSKLFDSWAEVTAKNGIAAAADHSRIGELDRGILRIEADHPGWIQLLQTRENKLLDDFRRRFPGMDISGISLVLGRNEPHPENSAEPAAGPPRAECSPPEETRDFDYDNIKDETFRAALRRLEESIAAREREKQD